MQIHLFMMLFIITFITLCLSFIYPKEEQAYRFIFSMLAFILSVALALSAFNIEIIEQDAGTFYTHQIYDWGLIGIGLAFIIISFLHTLEVIFLGSLDMYLLKRSSGGG